MGGGGGTGVAVCWGAYAGVAAGDWKAVAEASGRGPLGLGAFTTGECGGALAGSALPGRRGYQKTVSNGGRRCRSRTSGRRSQVAEAEARSEPAADYIALPMRWCRGRAPVKEQPRWAWVHS